MPFAINPPPASVAPAAGVAQAELARRGDDFVVARYYSRCGEGAGARRTATGDPGWVALTVDLMTRSRMGGACESEALPQLLGEAMARRPRVVLPYVDRSPALAAARICLPVRIEPSAVTVRADVRRLRVAMGHVADPSLRAARDECRRVADDVAARDDKRDMTSN